MLQYAPPTRAAAHAITHYLSTRTEFHLNIDADTKPNPRTEALQLPEHELRPEADARDRRGRADGAVHRGVRHAVEGGHGGDRAGLRRGAGRRGAPARGLYRRGRAHPPRVRGHQHRRHRHRLGAGRRGHRHRRGASRRVAAVDEPHEAPGHRREAACRLRRTRRTG